VGPDVPYGRRIELGFIGTDSLGRKYHQGPRPYLRPAFDSKQQEALQAMVQVARETIYEALDNEINARASNANRRKS
jgi:hypothetical protein